MMYDEMRSKRFGNCLELSEFASKNPNKLTGIEIQNYGLKLKLPPRAVA